MSNMVEEIGNANTMYLSIVGGNLVEKVEENTPGAKKREYETSDGKKGVKFEKHYKNLTGRITSLVFKETDFGEQLVISMQSGENTAMLSLNTESKYFTALARKLPNVDLGQDIRLNPFDFKSDDGKQLRGITVWQDGKKVEDYYFDGKKNINGLPVADIQDKKDKDEWKMYFIKVKKFLKKEVEKLQIPELSVSDAKEVFDDGMPEF